MMESGSLRIHLRDLGRWRRKSRRRFIPFHQIVRFTTRRTCAFTMRTTRMWKRVTLPDMSGLTKMMGPWFMVRVISTSHGTGVIIMAGVGPGVTAIGTSLGMGGGFGGPGG